MGWPPHPGKDPLVMAVPTCLCYLGMSTQALSSFLPLVCPGCSGLMSPVYCQGLRVEGPAGHQATQETVCRGTTSSLPHC